MVNFYTWVKITTDIIGGQFDASHNTKLGETIETLADLRKWQKRQRKLFLKAHPEQKPEKKLEPCARCGEIPQPGTIKENYVCTNWGCPGHKFIESYATLKEARRAWNAKQRQIKAEKERQAAVNEQIEELKHKSEPTCPACEKWMRLISANHHWYDCMNFECGLSTPKGDTPEAALDALRRLSYRKEG